MSNIGIIYNTNKLLEEKMNFFCDYFSFYTTYAGTFFETELENPLSLIEKIIFQLDHNRIKEKAYRYIANYLNHSYFSDNSFMDIFESYKSLKIPIKEFKSIEEKYKCRKEKKKQISNWLKIDGPFVINLRILYKDLQERMYQTAFEKMLQMMTSSHDLKKHEVEIKYLTKILVTEPLFKGRSKSEVRDVFLRVLSDDIKNFPFPKVISSDQKKIEYINSRDFAKQFHGLVNFLDEEPDNKYFLCKVFGVSIEDSSSFSYNRTAFLGKNDPKIKTLKAYLLKAEETVAEMFFSGSNYLIAIIPVKVFRDEIIVEDILPELRDSIEYLEIVLDKYLFIDHKSYILTTGFLTGSIKVNGGKGVAMVSHKDKKRIDDNPFTFLRNCNSPAKDHLVTYERIFLHAMHYNNLDEYWQYFENLLSRDSAKETVDIVASLILLNEKEIRGNRLLHYLFQNTQPWYFDYRRLGIEPVAYIELLNNLRKFKSKNFFDTLDYPFFAELKKLKQKKHTSSRYNILQDYYTRILWELCEVRNSITHKNLIQQRAKIKLQNSVHEVANRFRWVLFAYIRKYPNLNFMQLINKAKADSLKLRKMNT